MKLTIGMAHHRDYDGVYFTIQALRLYQDLEDVEFVIVDNSGGSPESEGVKGLIPHVLQSNPIKYIDYRKKPSTTQTREYIFTAATGDAVLVMDCHVMLVPGAIKRLKEYYASGRDEGNLLTGPLVYDNLMSTCTHFNLQWRSEMWGTWGSAWSCPHCEHLVTTENIGEELRIHSLTPDFTPLDACPNCQHAFPRGIAWPGHEQKLIAMGWKRAADDMNHPPFEIPAQGLGLFSSRRETWLGFNPYMLGFGGEEGYIHEKYRQAGRKAMCLPFLRWLHRFGRPGGPKYPLTLEGKVRNYILGFNELKRPLDEVYKHFVTDTQRMTDEKFQAIAKDPIGFNPFAGMNFDKAAPVEQKEHQAGDTSKLIRYQGKQSPHGLPPIPSSLEQIYKWTSEAKRDLDQHLKVIREVAAKCDHVTEFTKRRESTVALLAAVPKRVISYHMEDDPLLLMLQDAIKGRSSELGEMSWTLHQSPHLPQVPEIEETDLLFVDTYHNGARARLELQEAAKKVRKFIVYHDTQVHGEKGDDGKDGIFAAMQEHLAEHPEWFVYAHYQHQYGLTILCKDPALKPELPVHAWPPGKGPGTEMFHMLKDIGVTDKPQCGCRSLALQMDRWGVEGCRVEQNFQTILAKVDANSEKWSWSEKLAIAAKNIASPGAWSLAWRINPLDLHRSLIEEAIRRAEVKEQEACKSPTCEGGTCDRPNCKKGGAV